MTRITLQYGANATLTYTTEDGPAHDLTAAWRGMAERPLSERLGAVTAVDSNGPHRVHIIAWSSVIALTTWEVPS